MIQEQIGRLYRLRPFQPCEMSLIDQRILRVENLDFVSLASDRTTITVYKLPDEAEVIAVEMIVSLKFREPELMLHLESRDV